MNYAGRKLAKLFQTEQFGHVSLWACSGSKGRLSGREKVNREG
jgi:hypothetical protein